MKEMYTLNNQNNNTNYGEISKGQIIEKKSNFLSFIFKITEETQAVEYINKIKNNYKDARHIVYIYSYIKDNVVNIRFSDDGEPKGTGTKAIYELLTKENITNICIVIVRYFGGILLGAGPLSRAYLNTAKEGIKNCTKEIIYNYIPYEIKLIYSKYDIVKDLLDKRVEEGSIIINDIIFTEVVTLKLSVIDKYLNDIKELFE